MSLEQDILFTLGTRDGYDELHRYLDTATLSTVTSTIVKAIDTYYQSTPSGEVDWSSFLPVVASTTTLSPTETSLVSAALERQRELADDATYSPAYREILSKYLARHYAELVGDKAYELATVTNNPKGLEPLEEILERYRIRTQQSTQHDELDTDGIVDDLADPTRNHGFEWKHDYLNLAIGPVGEGDHVLIYGRPETGKTSFLLETVTHCVTQFDEPGVALVFNNEEKAKAVASRVIQTALGVSHRDILSDPIKVEKDYKDFLGEHKIIVVSDPNLHIRKVERICRKYNPKVIAINIIDKVRGFQGEKEVDRLRYLLQWGRGLAHQYGPTFSLMQADASASGQRWLTMDMVYGSKTAVQGEADLMLGIGQSYDSSEEHLRFLSIVKNKLPGGPKSDPKHKHGQCVFEFRPDTGQYTEVKSP